VIIADGFDGYYARKFNEESEFGGNFDMETDSFLAAVMTTLIYLSMDIGPWILVAGYLRYLFVFTLRVLGLHNETSPAMPGAKLIAVLFFITLILPFLFPVHLMWWGLIVGALLIYFSFARELILIVKNKLEGSK
jgi:phosphatidylglycerophosphate synthase